MINLNIPSDAEQAISRIAENIPETTPSPLKAECKLWLEYLERVWGYLRGTLTVKAGTGAASPQLRVGISFCQVRQAQIKSELSPVGKCLQSEQELRTFRSI